MAVTAIAGSDQSLGVSPLSARTRTWYSVLAFSPVMLVLVAPPPCGQSVHVVTVLGRYVTLQLVADDVVHVRPPLPRRWLARRPTPSE